jgi:hypothetical protein
MSQSLNTIQSFLCGTAVAAHRICAINASAALAPASAATSISIGVSTEVGGDATRTMDVIVEGIGYLTMGAVLDPGTMLTSDATARGVAAAAGNRVIGILLEPSTAANQVCKILVNPSVM